MRWGKGKRAAAMQHPSPAAEAAAAAAAAVTAAAVTAAAAVSGLGFRV
jgi:hypothetical protein